MKSTAISELKASLSQYLNMEQEAYRGYEVQDMTHNLPTTEAMNKTEAGDSQKAPGSYSKVIEQLRKNKFNIQDSARILRMSRNTLTDHFRGICFQYLAENGGDIQKAAMTIAADPETSDKVAKKIERYYENLISNIKDCEDLESARKRWKKLFKNVPNEHSSAIETLVGQYMKSITKNEQ